MNLWQLKKHQECTINGFAAFLEPKVTERLKEMGIDNGQSIKCMRQSAFNGPKIYQVGGSVFALEQDIAQAIYLTSI